MSLKKVEKISKALGDSNRLKILKAIQSHNGKLECSSIVSSLNLAQPSISHHIKKLLEADLIESHKEGRFYFYTFNHQMWEDYLQFLRKL